MAASADGDGSSTAHSAPPLTARQRARRRAQQIPPYMISVAATLGGITAISCMQPFDVIKTRLQLDRSGAYRGMVHCGLTVMRTEGVRALWKGLTPYFAQVPIGIAFARGCDTLLRSSFKYSGVMRSSDVRMATNIGGIVLDSLLAVPFQVVKTRLQQQKGLNHEHLMYKGPIHCAKAIIRKESLLGLWVGGAPAVIYEITQRLAMYAAVDSCNVILWKKHHKDRKDLHPLESMISTFLGYAVGASCAGPFDVVMVRLMAQNRSVGYPKYTGMIHAMHTIYVEEGLQALWKGLLPRIIRYPPGHIIFSLIATQIIGFYERNNLRVRLTFPK